METLEPPVLVEPNHVDNAKLSKTIEELRQQALAIAAPGPRKRIESLVVWLVELLEHRAAPLTTAPESAAAAAPVVDDALVGVARAAGQLIEYAQSAVLSADETFVGLLNDLTTALNLAQLPEEDRPVDVQRVAKLVERKAAEHVEDLLGTVEAARTTEQQEQCWRAIGSVLAAAELARRLA